MSTTVGSEVAGVPAAILQGKQRCAACGRPKSIGAFACTCATCVRKASAERSVRWGVSTASATAAPGVPTATDVALEVRIAGIAAALREAQQARGTLARDWKIGQLQLALVTAVRMRSSAQIVRLMMRTETLAVAVDSGDRP